MIHTIYIKLLDEEIEVWRPVLAKQELSADTFFILNPPDNIVGELENWEYSPGSTVKVKEKISDGKKIMVAYCLIH